MSQWRKILYVIQSMLRTSKPTPRHKVFPYLLRGLVIERPNQVWCADIA